MSGTISPVDGPADEPAWVADPSLPWQILLAARLDAPPADDLLLHRLAHVARQARWSGAPAPLRHAPSYDALLGELSAEPDASFPVGLGVAEGHLVVRAHHSHVDGLGLLALLSALLDAPVRSTARGVGDDRPQPPFARAALARLGEVAWAPPARIAPTAPGRPTGARDAFASTQIAGTWRTSDLVAACTRALPRFAEGPPRRARRVAVAVGASRVSGAEAGVRDDSALIRLRTRGPLAVREVRALLAAAPLQPAPGPRAGDARRAGVASVAAARGTGIALRLLGARLGSTVLVSHLGVVDGAAPPLAFYPVTGGGSGLSVGAVSHRGSTTLTARARGSRHDDEGLQEILEALVVELGR